MEFFLVQKVKEIPDKMIKTFLEGNMERGRNDEILSATKNATLRNQLYEKYSIV